MKKENVLQKTSAASIQNSGRESTPFETQDKIEKRFCLHSKLSS